PLRPRRPPRTTPFPYTTLFRSPLGGTLVRTDATLGVGGRPQSASGQTTILTGVNAPALLGYHKQGFPNASLREIIREHSVFLRLDRKSTRLNSSHSQISYAVFC